MTGTGPDTQPLVRRFSAATFAMLDKDLAYNPAFLGGIFVGAD